MSLTSDPNLKTAFGGYLDLVEQELRIIEEHQPVSLFYDPIRYFLKIPGKRIRPLLVFLSAEIFGAAGKVSRFAAAAVEMLHNFTLVHDDIMDEDNLRRGQPTVHTKWDVSTAILTGDGLMGLAFQKLLQSPRGDLTEMSRRFVKTMLVICEGQGLDKMFEKRTTISEEEYLNMIGCKTAALLQLSCQLGGLVAGAEDDDIHGLGELGYALGMAFQIQDDLLDIIGGTDTIGKDAGSDLGMHKKTLPAIKLQSAYPDQDIFALNLHEFKALLRESGVLDEVTARYEAYFSQAEEKFQRLPAGESRDQLGNLIRFIRYRRW